MDVAAPHHAISVLIADDHQPFADALQAMLAADERLEVTGRARDGREAVVRSRELRPDVILMDISMPVLDGIEASGRSGPSGRARAFSC
jgi:DNA-binding NarL/FixJ family response regulator